MSRNVAPAARHIEHALVAQGTAQFDILGVRPQQRQWSDLAIARTTPCLLGLVSLIVLIAYELAPAHQLPIQQATWYAKSEATFADVIAFVRRQIWSARYYVKSTANADPVVIP